MLVKKSTQFLSAIGCAINLSAMGCGAAPDAQAEPTERASSALSAEKASPEQRAAPAETQEAAPTEEASSMLASPACHEYWNCPVSKSCTPWYDYDCRSCQINSQCVETNNHGHPIPGTGKQTVSGVWRLCYAGPGNTTSPSSWYEYDYVFIACGC